MMEEPAYYPTRETDDFASSNDIREKISNVISDKISVGDILPYYGKLTDKTEKHIEFTDSLGKKLKVKKNSTSWIALFNEFAGLLSMSASLNEKQYGDILKIAKRSKNIDITDNGTVKYLTDEHLYSSNNMNKTRFH